MDIDHLRTEDLHPEGDGWPALPPEDIVRLFAREGETAANAVASAAPEIARLIEGVGECLGLGGRLILVGAGTSARLAAMQAAECPPTFGTRPSLVQALVAGGPGALLESREGAEDSTLAGGRSIDDMEIGQNDVVLGISASGKARFVVGALAAAMGNGAYTALLTCNEPEIAPWNVVIVTDTGPELVSGSTRMKAATAHKLVLDTLTTTVMARTGRVVGGRMVGMRPTNLKLRERARRIVGDIAGVGDDRADTLLSESGDDVALAIAMARLECNRDEAEAALNATGGRLDELLAGSEA